MYETFYFSWKQLRNVIDTLKPNDKHFSSKAEMGLRGNATKFIQRNELEEGYFWVVSCYHQEPKVLLVVVLGK